LTDDTKSISAASLPIFHAPKLSPISQFRTIVTIRKNIKPAKAFKLQGREPFLQKPDCRFENFQIIFKIYQKIFGFSRRNPVKCQFIVCAKLRDERQIIRNNMPDSRVAARCLMVSH